MAAGHIGAPYRSTSSTRRLRARPSSLRLVATGAAMPTPRDEAQIEILVPPRADLRQEAVVERYDLGRFEIAAGVMLLGGDEPARQRRAQQMEDTGEGGGAAAMHPRHQNEGPTLGAHQTGHTPTCMRTTPRHYAPPDARGKPLSRFRTFETVGLRRCGLGDTGVGVGRQGRRVACSGCIGAGRRRGRG
jgi:hypothetical protein